MTFQAIVPMGGYAGWVFLNNTIDSQKVVHEQSLQNDTDYFVEHIGDVRTVDDLLSDRRLLSVALGAFGLEDDIDSKFFVGKVLEEGASRSDSLANKLSDKNYLAMSETFGFGEGVPARTTLSGFADEIVEAYQARQFEISVGDQNDDFRLAMAAQREIPDIAGDDMSEDAKWYSIMGSTYLRSVFETALGLPDSFASLDIDDQLDTFKAKAEEKFGSSGIDQFADPEKLDSLVQTFLLRSEVDALSSSLTSANTALILLGGQ